MLKLTLGTDSNARKGIPIFSGCIMYFAAALAGVARHSKRGNDKHNPGEPLHHARGKSMDHPECVPRHSMDMADMLAYIERGGPDSENVKALLLEEADALCWRSLAWSQELYEKYAGAPLAPGAKAAPAPVIVRSSSAVLIDRAGNEREATPSNYAAERAAGPKDPLPACLYAGPIRCPEAAVHGGPYCKKHAVAI